MSKSKEQKEFEKDIEQLKAKLKLIEKALKLYGIDLSFTGVEFMNGEKSFNG